MRPIWWAKVAEEPRKAITPIRISAGDSQEISNDRTCTTSVVPTSGPSIRASPAPTAIRPRLAKETSRSTVAVELCSSPATPTPRAKELSRCLVKWPRTLRISAPYARVIPVRTMRVAQSSSATPPTILRSNIWPFTARYSLPGRSFTRCQTSHMKISEAIQKLMVSKSKNKGPCLALSILPGTITYLW